MKFLLACMFLAFCLFVGMWLLNLAFAVVCLLLQGFWMGLCWVFGRLVGRKGVAHGTL